MPQITRDGQLVEVSQAEYDALTQNSQSTEAAPGSYEQYAAARAKEQAVTKLADADAGLESSTNVSPEFQQELSNIRTNADAAAGDRKDAYAARYQQEQQDLYTNAPISRAALEQELSAPPPTTAPGTVAVGVPQQQGTAGQTIGTLNSSIPGLSEPRGPIVSEPVKGLTAGGLTASSAEASPSPAIADEVPTAADPNFVVPDTDPQVPQTTVGPRTAEESQAAYVAAKDNPDNLVTDDGTVVIDRGDGSVERIRPDGSISISDATGTRTFSPEGQSTSYTSPTVNGFSETKFADGATTVNQVIPIGEGSSLTIVTNTTSDGTVVQQQNLDAGYAQAQTVTVDGQLVSGSGTIADLDGTGQTVLTALTPEQQAEAVANAERAIQDRAATQQALAEQTQQVEQTEQQLAVAEAELAATEQAIVDEVRAGGEPTAEQGAILQQQQEQVSELQQELAAEQSQLEDTQQALGVDDPTILTAQESIEDPEVSAFEEAQTPEYVPLIDEQVAPAEIDIAEDPEAATYQESQSSDTVSAAEIEETPPAVSPANDPEVPAEFEDVPVSQVDDGGDALVVDDPQAPGDIESFSTDLVEVEPEVVDGDVDPEAVDPFEEIVPLSEIETEENAVVLLGQDPEVDSAFEDQAVEALDAQAEIEAEAVEEFQEYQEEQIDAFEESVENARDEQDAFTDEVAEYFEEDPNDFRLSAADIDQGDDLDQDPGPGYGDQDEPLDLDLLDAANEVEVDPYTDVLGRDLTEEEIQAEDNPIDYDTEDEIDPYTSIADRDLTEEEIQAQDNPIDYDTEDEIDPYAEGQDEIIEFTQDGPVRRNAGEATQEAVRQQSTLDRARQQATLQAQRKQANDGDWRVKIRLAPGAEYLYKAPQPGILQPLAVTDGVVFPYTPQITTVYKANYNSYDLTHSNYRGYFYQGSHVEDINITATFTAQDTNEANYLLAVIHFFRSVTKMFYGQDSQRGAPPPLVYLQGFGEYQFNLAPCVVASFNYNLPDSVDYIRAGSPNINGTNLLQRRDRQDLPTNPFSSAWQRLKNAGLKKGAVPTPPAPPTLGTNRPTYVPTKMEMTIILHPIQSREQVSKQFSLKQYANGDLLKGGFW